MCGWGWREINSQNTPTSGTVKDVDRQWEAFLLNSLSMP